MSDDFDIESLSKTWQTQEVANQFDETKFKKRVFIKRLTLLAITTVEVLVLLAAAWLLYMANSESWSAHLKVALIVALVLGGVAFFAMVKSRIKSYQMLTSATTQWMNFETKISEEALRRANYANYFVYVFSFAVLVSCIYEWMVLESELVGLAMRYAFGVVWLLSAWLINRYQIKKHTRYLSTLK